MKAISYIYLSILTLIRNLISKNDPLHIKIRFAKFLRNFNKENRIGKYITNQRFAVFEGYKTKQCLVNFGMTCHCHTQACSAAQSRNPNPYEILEMLLVLFI